MLAKLNCFAFGGIDAVRGTTVWSRRIADKDSSRSEARGRRMAGNRSGSSWVCMAARWVGLLACSAGS